jgi:hypothetical protein
LRERVPDEGRGRVGRRVRGVEPFASAVEEEGVGPRREAAAGVVVDGRVGAPRRQGGEGYRERESGDPARPPHLGGARDRPQLSPVGLGLLLLRLLSSLRRRRRWTNVRDPSGRGSRRMVCHSHHQKWGELVDGLLVPDLRNVSAYKKVKGADKITFQCKITSTIKGYSQRHQVNRVSYPTTKQTTAGKWRRIRYLFCFFRMN